MIDILYLQYILHYCKIKMLQKAYILRKMWYNMYVELKLSILTERIKMSRKNKVKIFRILVAIVAIAIIIGVIAYLVPVMRNLSTVEGQEAFKNKVNDSGFIGLLMLFGLQVAQIFLFILPGEPIEILAGMCYGGWGGLAFITISVFIITTSVFFLVRKLGKRFVYDFCDEEKVKKIENSKLFKNPKKIEWIMIILFMIPGTPKDLLVYIAGLLPIKPLNFILISTFARLPSVVSSTFAGNTLMKGDWKSSLVIYAVTFFLVGVLVLIINKFDKSKTTEEALKSIQNEIK